MRTAIQKLFDLPNDAADDIARTLRAETVRLNFERLRVLRPRGWKPDIRVEGIEHIGGTLSAGRAAILWVAPFVHNTLVTKMSLAQSGFYFTQLSAYDHGFSSTRIGVRVLNRFAMVPEGRFLKERLVMNPGPVKHALRDLTRLARRAEVIGIVATALSGQRTEAAPLLSGGWRVAAGAPLIAHRTGAALFAVFTIREANGSFVTKIEPIDLDFGAPRSEVLPHAVRTFASMMSRYVERFPGQFGPFETGRNLDARLPS